MTWSFYAVDVRCFEVFNDRCLRSVADIRRSDRISSAELKNQVLGTGAKAILSLRIKLSGLR